MDTTTLLIIVIIVLLLGGGGFYMGGAAGGKPIRPRVTSGYLVQDFASSPSPRKAF
jgi:hypothetical protein